MKARELKITFGCYNEFPTSSFPVAESLWVTKNFFKKNNIEKKIYQQIILTNIKITNFSLIEILKTITKAKQEKNFQKNIFGQ